MFTLLDLRLSGIIRAYCGGGGGSKTVGNRGGGFSANGVGRGLLGVERLSRAAGQAVPLDLPQVTLTFTICIFVLGLAAFFGGLWLNKAGPRRVALTGGFLYGLGVLLASFSADKLWWLYLSYGVIGGIGTGFGSSFQLPSWQSGFRSGAV
jgi:MFS family permease